MIARCTKHSSLPLTDKKCFCKFQQDTASGQPTKIYTRKELVMMETTISNSNKHFNISAIQKFVFHIPHAQILGTNHCGDSRQTEIKRRKSFQDVLCCRDYADRVVASFSHQTELEYYGGNRSVSIEVITLENFSALPQT